MESRPESAREPHARERSPRYTSYLLRLRYVAGPPDGAPVCQVMLQNVATEERRYFDNLASLIAFLEEETRAEGLERE